MDPAHIFPLLGGGGECVSLVFGPAKGQRASYICLVRWQFLTVVGVRERFFIGSLCWGGDWSWGKQRLHKETRTAKALDRHECTLYYIAIAFNSNSNSKI
jgi:hypothetical protein